MRSWPQTDHSRIALLGHSSIHAPQSTHLDASITAISSQVIAPSGQTSTHAPHATHSDALIETISIPLKETFPKGYINLIENQLGVTKNQLLSLINPNNDFTYVKNIWPAIRACMEGPDEN